jgi:pyruvate dehydrogenase complex dehydrogenase (E1) component
LDIAQDGALCFCNEIRGDVAKKHNIKTLTAKGLKQFMNDREQEYIWNVDCGGHCAWSVYANTASAMDVYFHNKNQKEETLK